jgi:hypothetical protein
VTTGARVGSTVTLAVRPEKLGLWHADAERDLRLDALTGTIRRVTFLGNAISYLVVAGDRTPIAFVVRQGNTPGIEHFAEGERVRVRWLPGSVAVLED